MAKDGSKRIAFLDFGSKTGKAFVGSSYGAHKTIAIVNLDDQTSSEVVSGEELWHPNLWIDSKAQASIASGFDPDSLGVYYFPGGSEGALQLRNKMEILWTHLDARMAILGSSRTFHGVNPLLLDDTLNAINLSNIPNSTYVSEYIFRNYLIPHLSKLRYVVVDLGIDFWYQRSYTNYSNFFYKDYRSYPGFAYDEDHQFWPEGIPEALPQAAHDAHNFQVLADIYIPNRGFKPLDPGTWGTEVTVDYDSTWIDKDPDAFTENLNTIKAMVDTAANHSITVIGVIFPQSPAFKNTNSFGRYGMRRSLADALIQEIANVSTRSPNFIFMDENKMGDHDYTDEMAYDKDHLSVYGAAHFTKRLDSLLKAIQ